MGLDWRLSSFVHLRWNNWYQCECGFAPGHCIPSPDPRRELSNDNKNTIWSILVLVESFPTIIRTRSEAFLIQWLSSVQNIIGLPGYKTCVFFCTGFGCVMDTRRLWCPLGVYYTPKVCITQPNFCVWASSIFFSKRCIGPRVDKKKRRSRKFFCTIIIRRTHCSFIILGTPLT
jgi:hypothetical protein